MKAQRVESWRRGFERCIMNAQKVWSCNKLKKWSAFCNRWVFVRNPDTSKEIVHFVHKVHPVFAVTLSTFLHMLCGWNYDTMPTFNLFWVHLKCFSISGSFSSKQISQCMKNSKWCQKGLKVDDVALNGAYWPQKSLENWSVGLCNRWVFVRTLILRKRLCSLYKKCVQFLP